MDVVAITRHFQDWNRPCLPAAVSILCRDWIGNGGRGPLDLRNSLIVIPTRHAGRRLRAELARIAAARGTAVLSGPIVTPEHLLSLPPDAAPDAVVLALLARRLLDLARRNALRFLLPAPGPEWSFAFALGIAAQIEDVRRQLAEADRSLADLLPAVPDEERGRWSDLVLLERGLHQELRRLGLQDPLAARRTVAGQSPAGPVPERVEVLFVPDLAALTARTLQTLGARCDVHLHILAPPAETARFDDWGRPQPERWENEPLPLTEAQIHVFEQAPDETRALAGLLCEAMRHDRALSLCTPDPANARALVRRLQAAGQSLFLPNGITLAATSPGRLLLDWLALHRTRRYAETAAFLRHPDVQDWLVHQAGGGDSQDLLSQLDQCHRAHLPADFEDLRRFAARDPNTPGLARALETLAARFDVPLPDFLAELYDCRPPGVAPTDPVFADAVQALSALVRAAAEAGRRLELAPEDDRELLRTAIGRDQVFPRPGPADTRETVGWLEVQWETAPALLLADMREGIVPETRIGDAFLPDSLRVRAGIPGNREALARDLFLARALLASRPAGGVRFLFSRRSASQEPQLPSRLLLACPDADLPERIARLFDRPALGAEPGPPVQPRLNLVPPPLRQFSPLASLAVSDFRAYLACPFRFYLARILGMAAEDDGGREIDPLGYGTLAHDVLSILRQHPALECEEEIRNLLLTELARLAAARHGRHPPLAVRVQLDSLRQRLAAAAGVQAAAVRAGWRIIAAEHKYEAELNVPAGAGPVLLRARFDRVERHLENGRIRILDYKTSEAGLEPAQAHYQPRNRQWLDLQLPLYRYIYEQLHPRALVSAGYFNLPKAVQETRIAEFTFQDKNGADLYPAALDTARQIAADIQARRFWPPADLAPDRDDFALLFSGGTGLITPGETSR